MVSRGTAFDYCPGDLSLSPHVAVAGVIIAIRVRQTGQPSIIKQVTRTSFTTRRSFSGAHHLPQEPFTLGVQVRGTPRQWCRLT